ncbi:MAG: hypothetical protein HeimC2_08570 [Candidatus Heimdallarchaeota archaeon LC_2]|nr:MAG: hypothetical protein HeimC2_08570 [Candidatus Heimdallarchaeota archaeon LC_2]
MKIYCKLFFIISLLLFSSSILILPITASLETDIQIRYPSEYNLSQFSFNSSDFIEDIISELEREAVYENEKLLGWPFRLNGPFENHERMYRGYNVGMAGIGEFLLNAYNKGYNKSKPLLDDIITHFIENAELSLGGGHYWGRFSNEDTGGWTGLRYGNAGIIKFLSNIDKSNYNTSLTTLIESGYTFLKSLQLDDGSWPMTENGYITTDTQYGAVGIGTSFLELYQNTGNSTYYDEATNIGNYLINNGYWEEDRFLIPWTPQAIESEFDGLIVYGKSGGLAGIIDYLNKLYLLTLNHTFLDTSIGLGKSILYSDLGGYWPDGSVSYVSRIYTSNIALTGYDVGSSGIAVSLLDLYDTMDSEQISQNQILEASARAEKFVLALLNDDYSLPVGLAYQMNKITGKSLGSAGLALHQLELYERYGTPRHMDLAINIFSHLHDLFKSNTGLPLDESDIVYGYSFNLEDGIAGIGNILLYLESVSPKNSGYEYEEIYTNMVPNLSLPETTNENSNSSKTTFNPILYNFIIIFTMIIITVKRLKYK